MKCFKMAAICAAVLFSGFAISAGDAPKASPPTKQHEILKQFDGTWEAQTEMFPEPGKGVKGNAIETTSCLGGYWSVTQIKGECGGEQFTGIMTLGYDSSKSKYCATYICSKCETQYKMHGNIDESGKILTLEGEGPCPKTGKIVKMRDVIELKDNNTKVCTNSAQGEDGQWVVFMTSTAKRKQ